MISRCMGITAERVADKDRVIGLRVEVPVGLIGNNHILKKSVSFQTESSVKAIVLCFNQSS
jgi:hypothetical protein